MILQFEKESVPKTYYGNRVLVICSYQNSWSSARSKYINSFLIIESLVHGYESVWMWEIAGCGKITRNIRWNDKNRNFLGKVSSMNGVFFHFPKIHQIFSWYELQCRPRRQFFEETKSISSNLPKNLTLFIQYTIFKISL